MIRAPRHQSTRGLSVIEALIAIAILGIAFSGLLSWRQMILQQITRVEALEHDNRSRNNALALLADINPMTAPAGAFDLSAGETVSWQAIPLSTPSRSTAYPNGEGEFIVALYRLDVRVLAANGQASMFSMERVGWRPYDPSRETRMEHITQN
jgi:type II secretory pathway pseudopilin PulG